MLAAQYMLKLQERDHDFILLAKYTASLCKHSARKTVDSMSNIPRSQQGSQHLEIYLWSVSRQVEVVEVPWGGGADEAKLEQILKADTDKKIKAVAVVHNETTTGVTSDIGQVRQVSRPLTSLDDPVCFLVAVPQGTKLLNCVVQQQQHILPPAR